MMKKLLLVACVAGVGLTGCMSTSEGPSLAEMDFDTMSCSDIAAAFESYNNGKSTVSQVASLGSLVGIDTSVATMATGQADQVLYQAKSKANIALSAKGCKTLI